MPVSKPLDWKSINYDEKRLYDDDGRLIFVVRALRLADEHEAHAAKFQPWTYLGTFISEDKAKAACLRRIPKLGEGKENG